MGVTTLSDYIVHSMDVIGWYATLFCLIMVGLLYIKAIVKSYKDFDDSKPDFWHLGHAFPIFSDSLKMSSAQLQKNMLAVWASIATFALIYMTTPTSISASLGFTAVTYWLLSTVLPAGKTYLRALRPQIETPVSAQKPTGSE